jgi:hypothetical protein
MIIVLIETIIQLKFINVNNPTLPCLNIYEVVNIWNYSLYLFHAPIQGAPILDRSVTFTEDNF